MLTITEITPRYTHSKIGLLLFNLCARATKCLVKHPWLFYVLSGTTGILMTGLGAILVLGCAFLKLVGLDIQIRTFLGCLEVVIGPDLWGGVSFGPWFFRDKKSIQSVSIHEVGHSVQNCIFSVFFPFIVAIPSALRWWSRVLWPQKSWPDYPAIWFEDAADQCGMYIYQAFQLKNKAG